MIAVIDTSPFIVQNHWSPRYFVIASKRKTEPASKLPNPLGFGRKRRWCRIGGVEIYPTRSPSNLTICWSFGAGVQWNGPSTAIGLMLGCQSLSSYQRKNVDAHGFKIRMYWQYLTMIVTTPPVLQDSLSSGNEHISSGPKNSFRSPQAAVHALVREVQGGGPWPTCWVAQFIVLSFSRALPNWVCKFPNCFSSFGSVWKCCKPMQTPKTYGDFNQYDHETVDLWVFVFWMQKTHLWTICHLDDDGNPSVHDVHGLILS